MERIEFCSTDIEELKTSCRALIEAALGRKVSDADPLWLFCNSLLAIIVQQRALINTAANENLLAFATGANLECLGELFDVHRLPATSAICTVELTLSAARATATTVRAGTRISTADNVHFALDDDVIFLAGPPLARLKAKLATVILRANSAALWTRNLFWRRQQISRLQRAAQILKLMTTCAKESG